MQNVKKQRVVSIKKKLNKDLANWGCPVCGNDYWCGTDGCPLDFT
jgi:uncharacterized protein with PIN domain